jgi:acetylornithine deacetylase/succinyl-diaminopimelate desuccinylase-like protein
MSATATTSVIDRISDERCAELLVDLIRQRSVVGEETTGNRWMAKWLRAAGMRVDEYSVENTIAPLVLGELGGGDRPGVLFDGHFDTVFAVPNDWSHAPWAGERDGDVVYGRGAVDSKGSVAAMLAAIEAIAAGGVELEGPVFFMSDSDGERAFRGAALMADLKIAERIGTIFSAEATSNERIEIAYPGISTWKITAIGRTAHPTEPERGINAVAKMAKLVQAVEAGRLHLREGASPWFKPRVTTNAIRTRPGGGWSIPATCDAVLSILSPNGVSLTDVRDDIDAFLRNLEAEDGEVRFEMKLIPMGGGRLWLRPAEADPEHPGVLALKEAVRAVTGREAKVGPFNGGWVDGAELMRADGTPACLVFGPGDFELAHAVDENISIREVAEAARIYAHATLELLTS